MIYFIIGGAIIGLISGTGLPGIIAGAVAGAAIRRFIFRNFWM